MSRENQDREWWRYPSWSSCPQHHDHPWSHIQEPRSTCLEWREVRGVLAFRTNLGRIALVAGPRAKFAGAPGFHFRIWDLAPETRWASSVCRANVLIMLEQAPKQPKQPKQWALVTNSPEILQTNKAATFFLAGRTGDIQEISVLANLAPGKRQVLWMLRKQRGINQVSDEHATKRNQYPMFSQICSLFVDVCGIFGSN